MLFEKIAGIKEIPAGAKIIYREAIRGIVVENNAILMIRTSNGDYKFPGGGAEKGESHAQTLKREFIEETGWSVSDEMQRVGVITEQKLDSYEENAYFVMKSYYYRCKLDGKKQEQHLDPYEKDLDFKVEIIPVLDAHKNNLALVKKYGKIESSPWLWRETAVLEYLCKSMMKL